jgi:hypothetical protein
MTNFDEHETASAQYSDRKLVETAMQSPLAVVVDPTDGELREFEAMLAKCPNCSQWLPGDGPIMAVLSSDENSITTDPKNSPDTNPTAIPPGRTSISARRHFAYELLRKLRFGQSTGVPLEAELLFSACRIS